MTKREIVAEFLRLRDRIGEDLVAADHVELSRLIDAVEALPDPEEDPSPKLGAWRPGTSMWAFAPGDCVISMKAAIGAGARIVIEPANPESES